MARRVFFSFHYQNDIFRVNQIRKANIVEGVASAGFIDASIWEEVKKKGDSAIKKMIDDSLIGTTVTAVLIGSQTAGREYIDYEIRKSFGRNNGLLGIYIHNLKNQFSKTDTKGKNPFIEELSIFGPCVKTYDWVYDNGYDNFGNWVEDAYKQMNP
jgi:hypothetical protein